MKKIMILTIILSALSCGYAKAQIGEINISNGFLDREFDEERTLYYVDTESDEIPMITAEGATVIQNATGLSWNNLEERITVLRDDETGIDYRFVIRPRNEKAEILSFSISQKGELSLEYSSEMSKYLNLIILKPLTAGAENSFKISDVEEINDDTKILAVAELEGKSGIFTYKLPEDEISGVYTAILGGDKIPAENKSVIETYYISEKALENVLKELNQITGTDEVETQNKLDSFIEKYSIMLNIDKEKYNKVSNRNIFVKYLVGQDFSELAEVITNYDIAMALSKVNELPEKDMMKFIEENKTTLNVELTIYSQIDDLSKVAKILKNKEYDSIEVFNKAFHEAVSLVYINESKPSEIEERFEIVKDILIQNVSLSEKYEKCKDKTMVLKLLVNKDFENVNDFEQGLENAITESEKPVKENKPSKGGGGGGGTSIPYIPPVQEEIKPEPDEEKVIDDNEELYDDIGDTEWAREAILLLSDRKIVNGKGNKKFAPNDNVTREEFVKMLVEALRLESNNNSVAFNDVSEEEWYYKYILIGVGNNIIKGKNEDIFGTGENITREDMAVMTMRAMDAAKFSVKDKINNLYYKLDFKDTNEISEYAKESVEKLVIKGIVSGVGDNLYAPKSFATRAQAAQMIYNVIKDS